MNRRTLLYLAVALLIGVVVAIAATRLDRPSVAQADRMRAGRFDPPHAAPDFALRGSDGSEARLSRYRGKVVLLTFGFTSCAAVCPTTLSTLAQARTALGKAARSTQVIFVTVDPERDTERQLQDYVTAFHPTFIGATGTPAALEAVRKKYGVTATKEGAGPDYAVAHTSSIFLIDPAGKLRGVMPYGREAGDFVHDVNILLNG